LASLSACLFSPLVICLISKLANRSLKRLRS
jgi:hypothetical protein